MSPVWRASAARQVSVILLTLGLLACGGPPVQAWSPVAGEPSRWTTTLPAWTRRGEAYEAFEGKLFAAATCFSPALLGAWLTERAAREGWTAERLASEQAAQEKPDLPLRVLLGITAQDALWDDAAPAGTLEMSLSTNGEASIPAKIRRLSQDEMADLLPYFTWMTPLISAYMLEFPRPSGPERLQLRVAGPPARIELVWELPGAK